MTAAETEFYVDQVYVDQSTLTKERGKPPSQMIHTSSQEERRAPETDRDSRTADLEALHHRGQPPVSIVLLATPQQLAFEQSYALHKSTVPCSQILKNKQLQNP